MATQKNAASDTRQPVTAADREKIRATSKKVRERDAELLRRLAK